MSVALAMTKGAMDDNILGCLQPMFGTVGEGPSIVKLGDLLRGDVLELVSSSLGKVTFINDCGPDAGVVEGADIQKALVVVSSNSQKAEAMRNGIRTFRGRHELDRAWEVLAERGVAVQELGVASARCKGSRVNLGFEVAWGEVHNWCASIRSGLWQLRAHISRWSGGDGWHINGVDVGCVPPLIVFV